MRKIDKNDVQDFYELDSDPDVHIYLGNSPVKTLEESEKMIDHVLFQYKEYGLGRLAIIDKKSNEFIGWSGLKYETGIREFKYYDLGYRLKKKYWGKGVATETAIASLQYGFNELNLNEICAAAVVGNLASNRVLQKMGMTQGETFHFHGEKCNWYSLSKENFLLVNLT